MSQYHTNVRRTFKVMVIWEEGTDLYPGQELTVIGDDGKHYQVEDERGRKGKFRKDRFERIGKPTSPSKKRVKQAPAEPVRCVVLYDDGKPLTANSAMSYNKSVKMLEYVAGEYTVFASRREAKKAIWHTVHGVEWMEGYDPKEAASHYVIVPDHDNDGLLWSPDMKCRQVRW